MSRLDVLTPKGQVTVAQQRDALAAFHQRWGDQIRIETNLGVRSPWDGVMYRGTKAVAIMEVKCRSDMTLDTFFTRYGAEWLITYEDSPGLPGKLMKCIAQANHMGAPLFGLLYIVRSKIALFEQIYDGKKQEWSVKYQLKRTWTQPHINAAPGEKVLRMNAFVDMRAAAPFPVLAVP